MFVWLCLSIAQLAVRASSTCVREPTDQTQAAKTAGTNGFQIEIKTYPKNDSVPPPDGYIPGEFYTVILRGWRTQYTVQTFRGFSLVAVQSGARTNEEPTGKWKLDGRENTARMSDKCWHGLMETSLYPKSEVEVVWRAPEKNMGCIEFKAMVLEYRDVWYMDEGNLTKQFCQLSGYDRLIPNDKAVECCACDEAKYELLFEGLWSRQTHPRDYPSLEHLTHFSDLIGGSHSNKLSMWAYDGYATDGLKELAEWGNTYTMEQELKTRTKEIRTIIKARGLWYPNVQGKAKAMFRVDKYHHLMSLVSMLGPSPDWCVGVSSVNLCLPDCSWMPERSFELYPWDAGTDNGVSYMSPNNPALPPHKIKKITTKDPADPRNPFYDATRSDMPALAKLTLRRQKVYQMECKNISEYQAAGTREIGTSEDLEFKDKLECSAGSWTPWSLCSATCGKGIRMRSRTYKFPIKAQMFNCERQMTEKQFCNASLSFCADSEAFNDKCSASTWTDWSPCSVTCERGIRTRTRNYYSRAEAQQAACSIDLIKQQSCIGVGGDDCSVTPDPRCQMTFWSEYSPCSASCGEGKRVRTRLFYNSDNQHHCSQHDTMQEERCNDQPCSRFYVRHSKQICAETMEVGQCRGQFPRYYYDPETRACRRFAFTGCKGNRNNFETKEQCREACVKGYKPDDKAIDNRSQKKPVVPQNGQKSGNLPYNKPRWKSTQTSQNEPPSKMVLRRIANALNEKSLQSFYNSATGMVCVPANHLASALGVDRENVNDGGAAVDCMVTEWSPWSECSKTCGRGRRRRTRSIKVLPRNGGRTCPNHLIQKRRCDNPPCPLQRCRVTQWSGWSACTVSCGAGVNYRQRRVIEPRRANRRQKRCRERLTQRRVCANHCR